MAKKQVYDNFYNVTKKPVAGFPPYHDREKGEPSLDEMIDEQRKTEFREVQKEEAEAKMEARIARLRGTKGEETPVVRNPKRFIVDPGTGVISVDEEEGELTYKDAFLMSASIKGKSGQYDDAINLIKLVKALGKNGQEKLAEKPKEYYVDPETGIIVHDPDNGEYTLSEARTVSQSLQRSKAEGQQPAPGVFIDEDGNVHELKPGQPTVVKRATREPSKPFLDQITGLVTGLSSLKEVGPILRSILGIPEPASNPGGTPASITGPDGKPLVMDLGRVIDWQKFQASERREDEMHNMKIGLGQTLREVLPDGAAALKAAAEEIKGTGAKKPTPEQQQEGYRCGDCGTQFAAPAGWTGQSLRCPKCGREYSKEELET